MADNISPTGETDLNDTTTTADATPPQTTGVSNPPNDPIETSEALNNTSQQPAITPASQPVTPVSTPQPKSVDQSRGTVNAPEQVPSQPDYSNHPAVQRADLLHTIAQTLAGGPRFKTSINPNTGEMVHTAVPLSKGDIGLAIAAEAIQGSLAGLGVANGPGNLGRAAAAGGAATTQARQRVDQQQNEQANADFARHTQIFETNMRLHQNALAVGRQGFDQNQKYVSQFAPLVDQLVKDHPEVIKGIVNESDLTKYNVTKDSAMPYKTVPRIDPNTGKQATNDYGEPQWDTQYAIIDPNFKSGDFLDDADKKLAADLRLPGFADSNGKASDLPQSLPMRLSMATNIKSKLGAFNIAQGGINDYYNELNNHNSGASKSIFSMFNDTDSLADFISKTESGGKPDARSIRNNNPGNLIADASWRGKVDTSNLAPSQKGVGYRVYDTPEEGRQALVRQLELDKSRMPNATPEQYFQKYDAADAPVYAASARKTAGVEAPQPSASPHPPVDLMAAVQKDPTLLNALDKFNPMLEAAKGNYETAIGSLGKQDPQAAGKILGLLGGTTAVQQYDQKRANDKQASDLAVKNAAELDKQSQDRANKRGEQDADLETIAHAIAGDPNDPGSGDMASLKYLISQRTADRPRVYGMAKKINPNFNPQEAELKAKTWDDFNTGPESKAIRSGNTFLDHTGAALDASNQLSRASNLGSAFQEPLIKAREKYLGDAGNAAQLASFETELEPAATEFETLLSNAHALTETDKQNVARLKDPATSLAVKASTLRAMASTAAFRLKEYDNQYKRVFRTGVPGLLTSDGANVVSKLYDENGYNKTADILKDADVGGSFMGSGSGRGTPGQPLSAIAPKTKPGTQQPQQQPQVPPGGIAGRDASGKIVGYKDAQGTYHAF